MDSRYVFGETDPVGARFTCEMADGSKFAAFDPDVDPGYSDGVEVLEGSAFGPPWVVPQIRWSVMSEDEGSFLVRLYGDLDEIKRFAALCPSLVEASVLSDGSVLLRLSDRDDGNETMWANVQFLNALPRVSSSITGVWAQAIREWDDARLVSA